MNLPLYSQLTTFFQSFYAIETPISLQNHDSLVLHLEHDSCTYNLKLNIRLRSNVASNV